MVDRMPAPAHLVWKWESDRVFRASIGLGVLLHLALFLLVPPLATRPAEHRSVIDPIPQMVDLQREVRVVNDPPEVPLPSIPGEGVVTEGPDVPLPELPRTDVETPFPPPGIPHRVTGDPLPPLVADLPEVLHRAEPGYPGLAREAGAEGDVYVEVVVARTGRVFSARVLDSDTVPALRRAALEAARQWIFRPARQDGRPVAVRVVIPFRFRLNR